MSQTMPGHAGFAGGARRLDRAPSERLRLFAPATIVGFGLAVGLGLTLVFPHKTLEQELLARGANSRPDRLTVEYLKVFLKAEPKEHGLRLALATQLVGLGEYAPAREFLQPLVEHPDLPWRAGAAWLELEIREREAFALPAETPAHDAAMLAMREQLRRVAALPPDMLGAERVLALGRKALASGEPKVAAQAFRYAAAHPLPHQDDSGLAEASLALGEYRTSARLYFRSMAHSATLDERREYYLAGLRALQAASLFDEAIAAADEYLGPLADDRETLLFLTRLAQACDRPEAAQRYVRRLLQLAQWLPDRRLPAQFYRSLARQTVAAPSLLPASLAASERGPGLPFDEEAYSLGYQVFLAGGNLADALRLAQSAVRQQPASAPWRKRLAEISEWSGVPQAALPEWLAYARISGDERGWDAALRLAESMFAQDAVLEILRHKTQVDGGNRRWLEQLVAQYENAGEPEQALALLRERLFGARRPAITAPQRRQELELFANIAERSGADGESLQAYRVLQSEFGPSGRYGLRIANHLFRHGKISEAFAALREGAIAAPPADADFWRAFAEVARMLQEDEAARIGYRKLLESNQHGKDDLENLIASLQEQQPRAAAELAAFSYAANGDTDAAVLALNLFAQIGEWRQAQRFLASIAPQRLASLERNVAFLNSRSAVLLALDDLEGAGRDLRGVLELEPGNVEARASLLWVMMARRDTASLKRALRLWDGAAEAQPGMWMPLAAAYMSINQPAAALKWFRKSPLARNDYLGMLAYAECLDANAQPDLAWRLRRKAWLELRRPEVLSAMEPSRLLDLRDRLAALAPLFLDGDRGGAVVRALLRADSDGDGAPASDTAIPSDGAAMQARLREIDALPPSPLVEAQRAGRTLPALFAPGASAPRTAHARLGASARELVLAYALSREAHDLARAWMAARYASQLSRPVWGELSLALASDDRPALNRLLDDVPDWLPAYDRIEAAERAGRPALAQSFAFAQLEQVGHDDEAHLRLVNLVSAEPPGFQAGITQQRYFPLRITESRIEGNLALTPGWRLMLALAARRQHSEDAAQLAAVPARDDDVEIGLRRRTGNGVLSASLQRRQAATGSTGGRIDYLFTPMTGVTVSASAGIHQRATESALLRAGGMRSGVDGEVIYQFSKTEYARAGLGWHRYASQAGTVLGQGGNWEIEAGSHLRLEYPNLTLRAFASGSSFRSSGRFDAQIARLVPAGSDPASFDYMPAGSTSVGAALGWGTVIEGSYSRGWHPFVEIGLLHDSNDGRGYSISGGIVGSLLGGDLLVLRGQRSSATSGSPQGQQEIGLNYKWFF